MILDRSATKLIVNILNRTSIKVNRVQQMRVEGDAIAQRHFVIVGNFWASDGKYYSFSLDGDGKVTYRQQKTRRRI